MSSQQTLQSLAETLILESRAPFSAEEYLDRVQQHWRRRIAPSTLDRLRANLLDHQLLIDTGDGEFLPYPAVLDRIAHLPLLVRLHPLEWRQQLLAPGHRLLPMVSPAIKEEALEILDPEGNPLPKIRRKFFMEEVISSYEYSGEAHFPDRIQVNEFAPGKSALHLTVWDLAPLIQQYGLEKDDALRMTLLDYKTGRFQVEPYSQKILRLDKLRQRAFHINLENSLLKQWAADQGLTGGLEKQLLKALFHIGQDGLTAPAFSLPDFIESLEKMAVFRSDAEGLHLAPVEEGDGDHDAWEEEKRVPDGRTHSLGEIFEDMGLPFGQAEFKSILYVAMGGDDYDVESVFNLLFGGQKDKFHSKRQHNAFYKKLRTLLNGICEDLNLPEPKLVTELRSKAVFLKLRLIEILRFFETQEVKLQDLPSEILDQLADLDQFAVDALCKLSDRMLPPDVKSIRDIRLGLKMMMPHLDRLEEDIYYQLGIY